MLKQIKTLGIVLVIGTMLVGCDSEVQDVEIEDTNPTQQEQQVEEKEEPKEEKKIDKETYLKNLENSGKQFAVILMENYGLDQLNEQYIFNAIKDIEEVNEYTFKDDIDVCRLASMKGLIEVGNVNIKPEDMLKMYNYMIENNIDNVGDYYKILDNNEKETKEQPKEKQIEEVKDENIYDVEMLDKLDNANVRYQYLSKKEIRTIEKLMPEFIRLGKEHAELYNKEQKERYNYYKFSEIYDLAKTYENEFEHDMTYTYLVAAYTLAFTEHENMPEDITWCLGEGRGRCEHMFITDKYTKILNGYPEQSCGCYFEGEYIKDHNITAEEVFNILDARLINGYKVITQDDEKVVILKDSMAGEEVWDINLNDRHINVIVWSTTEMNDCIRKVYNPNWVGENE